MKLTSSCFLAPFVTAVDGEARPRLRNMHLGRLRRLSCFARQLAVMRTWGRTSRFHSPTDRRVVGLRAVELLAGPHSRTPVGSYRLRVAEIPRSLHNLLTIRVEVVAS